MHPQRAELRLTRLARLGDRPNVQPCQQEFGPTDVRPSLRPSAGELSLGSRTGSLRHTPKERPIAITEASLHPLHQALIDALGEQEAATLMELLPPIGWADVATTTTLDHVQAALSADIEHLRTVMNARLEAMDFKLDAKISDLRS